MWRSRLFYLLGSWILILTGAQLIPLIISIILNEKESFQSLFSSVLLTSLIGGALFLGFRSTKSIRTPRLTVALPVAGAAALATVAGLPFFFLLPNQGFFAAFFEGMSLITTTGSSAYEGSFDALVAISLWRAMVAWLGGYFAVCITLSFLTAMNIGGLQLHKSPLPFGDSELGYPRLKSIAETVYPVYLLVTVACILLLWISGLTFFEAVTLGLATISTTGLFEHYGNGLTNIWTQVILAAFMLLGIMNWDMHYARIKGLRLKIGQDPEFGSTLVSIAVLVILVTLVTGRFDTKDLWQNLFATISAISTTGIVPGDYLADTDNHLSTGLLLMIAAAIGGGVIGTGGGIKQLRVIVIYRAARAEIDRLVHPHSISRVNIDKEALHKRDIGAVWLLLGSFMLVLAFGSIALAMLGLHFQDALSMAFTALTLSGPLITVTDPLFVGFSGLKDADYFILSILMLFGRVETSLLLALFAKSLWRG